MNTSGFVVDAEGRTNLSTGPAQGIAQLLPQIADTPLHLRFSFRVAADADRAEIRQARAMMNMVERYIDQEWRNVGRAKLTTEQTIVPSGQ